ncbi:type IX secretion system membrane protein PorP/SprF [Candidatus Saganbacteria bacterium]|nr:type IX secretion system membrane protein PorP/SprF [Candidatus Saganbacteria bacterium]
MTNKLLISICLLAIFPKICLAGLSTDILNSSVGARPLAMGNSFTAIFGDSNSIAFNPAGISQTKTFEATTMQTKALNTVDYKLYGGTIAAMNGFFGLNYISALSPAGFGTTDKASMASASPISYSSSMFILTAAQNMNKIMKVSPAMGNLSIGLNVKYMRNFLGGVVDGNGSGIDCDFGLILAGPKDFNFGLSFQNFLRGNISWGSSNADKLPAALRLGGSYKLIGSSILIAADSESSLSEQKPLLLHFGTEWKVAQNLSFRAGVSQKAIGQSNIANNYTFGLGLKASGFSFDYAYMADAFQSELTSQYISISFSPEYL